VPLYPSESGKHYLVDVVLGVTANATQNATASNASAAEAPAVVGTRQTVRLIFDTGSGDVVVYGRQQCTAQDPRQGLAHRPGGLPCFHFGDSASFKFDPSGFNRRTCTAVPAGGSQDGRRGALCQEALLIDSYKAELLCEMGTDKIALAGLAGDGSEAVRMTVCVVNDTTTEAYKARYWNGTQGSLGMFYQLCGGGALECASPYPSILASVPQPRRAAFTLDVNPPGQPSSLGLGAPLGGWEGVEWSESQPVTLAGASVNGQYTYAFHAFEVYGLSVCGAPLLGTTSSHWTAMVDTGAACLTLPQELFDSLVAWVPALNCTREHVEGFDYTDCVDQTCQSGFKKLTICYLKDGALAADLPVLTLAMQDGGERLFLPLAGLLVNDRPSGRPRVCVNPTDSIASYQTDQLRYLLMFPKISLGTLALRNLVAAFDLDAMAVGLRNKATYSWPAGGGQKGCAAPAACVGAQVYVPASNSCRDPPCELLYFHEIDPATHTCRVQAAFVACGVLLLLCLAAAELALSEIYERLSRKLVANYALST